MMFNGESLGGSRLEWNDRTPRDGDVDAMVELNSQR